MKPVLGFFLIAFLIAVAITAGLLFTPLGTRPLNALFSAGTIEPTDFKKLTLTKKPNQFLMCPPNYCGAQPHSEAVEFEVPADALRRRWQKLVTTEPRVELVADHDGQQFDYVQRSARFRFPDIITVRFIPLSPSRSTLAVYSRSVYGHSDFGVNQQRVEAWLEKLRAAIEQ